MRRALALPFRAIGAVVALLGTGLIFLGILLIGLGTGTDPQRVSYDLGRKLR